MKFPFPMESHTDCCIARVGKNPDGWDIDGWDIDGWDIDGCCGAFLRYLLAIVDASR